MCTAAKKRLFVLACSASAAPRPENSDSKPELYLDQSTYSKIQKYISLSQIVFIL
jgi:hypothetical protein